MFRSLGNFLYRHKNKFLFGGGVVGGVVLLSKYAEYKLHQWHDNETKLLMKKQKRSLHYKKTKETANATVLSLSNSITKIISDELDTDTLLQAIQSQPKNKKAIWEDLKLVGFGRCIASVYTASFIGTFVHIHLMLLGSYTYSDVVESNQSDIIVTLNVQEKYLSLLQNLIEVGLPLMFKKIMIAVNQVVGLLPLSKQLSVEALEGILKDVILLLEGEEILPDDKDAGQMNYKISPWSQYVKEFKKISASNHEERILNNMNEELVDIINTADFESVMQTLIHQGLNYVLDYAANYYPQPDLAVANVSSTVTQNTTEMDPVNSNDKGARPKQYIHNNGGNDADVKSSFSKTLMPLAKVIPILSGIVHSSISPAPGHLLQSVLLNEKLENLSFNVYEAFSAEH